jgi:hypothetical protein
LRFLGIREYRCPAIEELICNFPRAKPRFHIIVPSFTTRRANLKARSAMMSDGMSLYHQESRPNAWPVS